MAIGVPDSVTAFGALHRELSVLYGKVARSYGLTPQQLELLCLVHKSRPTFGELAAALGCDKTNVTGMVDRLERRELLAREPDPADIGPGSGLPANAAFVISVAARLVGLHEQTLRYYERAGLVEPARSKGRIRLYSLHDLERVRQIRRLTDEMGVNLAGVEVIMRLTDHIRGLEQRLNEMQAELQRMQAASAHTQDHRGTPTWT